jgi:hypothetical protein
MSSTIPAHYDLAVGLEGDAKAAKLPGHRK